MNYAEINRKYSRELNEMLMLRYEPIAIKMIENEADVPKDAIYPRRDLHKHMALCQAFAMTRRDKKTVYMSKNDHWCWNPLVGLGLVECHEGTESFEVICKHLGIRDLDSAKEFFAGFPRLPYGKYIGLVSAPLCACTFAPDLVLIYSNNAQLRSMIWAVKNCTGKLVETQFDAIDSCIYSCVPPLKNGEYRVTIPDPGEYERAMADENEIIFSVPGNRLEELLSGLHAFYDHHMGYAHLSKEMMLDFPRPKFYNELYALWSLDQGEDWGRGV